MGQFITEVSGLDNLAQQTDAALQEIYDMARRGIVSDVIVIGSTRSYIYIDEDGVPKLYNASTGETKTINVT